FKNRVGVLDKQAFEIKNANWNNLTATHKTQLQGLQAQKSAEVGAVMQNLAQNLSQNSFNNLQSYIATRVKPKIKIIKTNNSAGTTQLRSE
ncbi:hypothetical protein OFN33_28205, partial [Escherichia coli]|nr:hypothetical protein [Escherichia coli]